MYKSKAYSAVSKTSPLASATIPRREPTDRDVQIEILFCGVCHSDLHYARDEWHEVMPAVYPCVPGHEIVGKVVKVGSAVGKFKTGDLVGVGCLVDSDNSCPQCKAGLEQFCPGMVLTYGSPDRHKTAPVTYGGYSDSIVVDERFVLRIPANLNPAAAAVRGDHHLLAHAALGRGEGQKGWRGWPWRAGAHGGEIRTGVWGARGRLHHLAGQGGRCPAAWRP